MEPIGIGLVGIAGYGLSHISAIAACEKEGLAILKAITVRPEDAEPDREAIFRGNGVRIYRTVDEMLSREKDQIRLISLPTGIPSHAELSIAALEAGYHVFCEKPAAGSYDDAVRMRESSRRTGNFLAIGYQHIYSMAVQFLKKNSLEGKLGRLVKAKALVLWPRDSNYYTRNGWAGRLRVKGKKVYDSPAQNAASHYLNVMLYIAGASPSTAACPVEIYGENYRAQDIESADTQFIRLKTDTGVDITYTGTHATREQFGPEIHYVFEKGVVEFSVQKECDNYLVRTGLTAQSNERLPGATGDTHRTEAFRNVIDAVQDGREPLCTIENAIQHTRCIQSLFEDACPVRQVARNFLKNVNGDERGNVNITIDSVEEVCHRMFQTELSFSESDAPWAAAGKKVRVDTC